MTQILEYRNITLLKVNDGRLVNFNSSIEKREFVNCHQKYTYAMGDNFAIEHLYMVIDTEGTGWNLTKKEAISYNEAKTLIDMYL